MKFTTDTLPKPVFLNRFDLNDDEYVFISIRFVSDLYPEEHPLHVSPDAKSLFDEEAEGLLVIDFWNDEETSLHLGFVAFEVGSKYTNFLEHAVDSSYLNRGLPFLAVAVVQNVTGWSRRLIGMNRLPTW